MRRRVGPGGHFLDIDLAAGEELGNVVHDAGLVHGHHVHEVRHHVALYRTRLGVLDGGGEVELLANDRHLAFEFGDRAPTAGDKYHQRELAAEHAHTAVLDVAAVVEDDLGQLVDDAGTVLADGGNDEKLLHDGIRESGCAAWEGSEVYPQNPARNRRGGYFLSFPNSALRSAKGLLVAVAGLEVVKPKPAPSPRTRVEYFWCSQSWQYMQRFSQLLPSDGLLSWLWSLWCTVSSCRVSRVNPRPQRPQTCGCNLSACSR